MGAGGTAVRCFPGVPAARMVARLRHRQASSLMDGACLCPPRATIRATARVERIERLHAALGPPFPSEKKTQKYSLHTYVSYCTHPIHYPSPVRSQARLNQKKLSRRQPLPPCSRSPGLQPRAVDGSRRSALSG